MKKYRVGADHEGVYKVIVDANDRDTAPASSAADDSFFLVSEVEPLLRAAKAVCDYDWSDNDEDAVRAIDRLRAALQSKS